MIDAYVGALGREDGGHEQFEGCGELEFAVGVRVGLVQKGEEGGDGGGGGFGHGKGRGLAARRVCGAGLERERAEGPIFGRKISTEKPLRGLNFRQTTYGYHAHSLRNMEWRAVYAFWRTYFG